MNEPLDDMDKFGAVGAVGAVGVEGHWLHIQRQINPGRVRKGLKPISEDEAREVYETQVSFFRDWAAKPFGRER